ncbi:hypothetical protein BDV97DRAFT_369684 [Delphinella strobiligena]|nr:hypothetical protein BDV97DRAFT_369684 [Delphinella strobiligena]
MCLLAFLCTTICALAKAFISATSSNVTPSSSDLHVQNQFKAMIVKTPEDCSQVLKARTLPGCSFENNLSPLESRAGPNQRLVTAFDISNCFVTSNAIVCSTFRSEASKLLRLEDEGWREMRNLVAISLKTHIPASQKTVKVMPKVQFISMKLVLHALCGHEGNPADDQRIYKLASEVNRQWIWSKKGDMSTGSRLPNIKRTLGELLPEWKEAGFPAAKNPLNLLLPGYETTWRVVLRGLIEVAFRDIEMAGLYETVLKAFFDDPTQEQLYNVRSKESGSGYRTMSASTIAKEALRLYPPTRRIYRRYESAGGVTVNAAADIEALQRNVKFWGDHASAFDPSRWTFVTEEDERKDFFAFGSSPFPCIAKAAHPGMMPFGVGMVALLIGGLSAYINRKEWAMKPSAIVSCGGIRSWVGDPFLG